MMFQSILAPTMYSRGKSDSIVGEVVTSYKRPKLEDCKKITSSRDGFDLLSQSWPDMDHVESFKVLMLSRSNHCVASSVVSVGGVAGTVADPKVIFQKALAANASGIILAHNHPSGNSKPSQADIQLTKKLKEGGQLLDIQVLDHIILCGENSYFSFADEGLM